MFIFLSTLIILTSTFSNSFAQIDNCPNNCEACVEDSLSCSKPGFEQVPLKISKTIRKIILANQIFTNDFLVRENFTAFSPPNMTLANLYIRQSNINLIKSKTFADLKKLEIVDITYHNDLLIQSRSFYGLTLSILKLDHNNHLKLEGEVFEGLEVSSLHISHSMVVVIPFSMMKPILPSLTQLFLENNSIVTLDPRYQVSFRNLKDLHLELNPLSCSCPMKWIADVYLYRRKHGKLTKNTFTETVSSTACADPPYMKGKFLHEVSSAMFLCDPPSLTELKINFQSMTQTELTCSATQSVDEASMSVEWFSDLMEDIGKKFSSIFSPTKTVPFHKNVHTESIIVHKKKPTDSYQCVAKNINGNTTATIKINWPPLEKSKESDINVFQRGEDEFQKPNSENYMFQKKFNLLEMFGAVFGTFAVTLLIFFLIYKVFFINRHLLRKAGQPPNGYTTYEATLYSDSQTYDVPGNAYPQSVLLPLPHLPTNNEHFLDFKTQKKLYQTT